MRINEIIVDNREMLDEGIKDTLKKIGLGALLSVSLAGPAQALDNIKMDDLLKMGMTQQQASEILKMPAQAKGEVVQRFEKAADNPNTTKQLEKIKSQSIEKSKVTTQDKKEITTDKFKAIEDPESGYYKKVDPAYEKNPFGDLLKGSGWESPPTGEMAKLKALDAKPVKGNPNLIAVFTTSIWGVKQFNKGIYKGLYVRGEPEQIWGVRIFDKSTGEEYVVSNKKYNETDANSVKKYFDSDNFAVGQNLGTNPFKLPYFNQAKKIIK